MPRLLAAEGHRMLLQDLPGRDGYEATPDEYLKGLSLLVDMQAASADGIDGYLAAGVPDCRWGALRPAAERVVALYRPDDEDLADLLAGWQERVQEISSVGLPDVLVHGDAHPGNLRVATDPPIWFDWGDSFIGHPLLELAVLGRDGTWADLLGPWLELWRRHFPRSDLERAWRLVHPLAELRSAVLYQRFLDAIEPSERVFHAGDPPAALARAHRALRT